MTINRNFTAIISGIVLAGLLIITFGWYWYRSKNVAGLIIADEVTKLADIFNKINETVGIASFDYQKNPINFLNIRSFVGSEVGSMNLNYPAKWEGPYLDDNPSIQGKDYLVIKTKDGYFITPGEGVHLSNGMIVGTDIKLDENADIPALIQNPKGLQWKGKALAVQIMNGAKKDNKQPERVQRLES